MGRVVDFNAANWENILNFSATAGQVGENAYIPIPPAESPIFLESDIVAVYASTSVPNGRNWRWAGYLEQRFQSGLTVGGLTDAAGDPKSFYINKITTIFFPSITAQYSLKFYFPKWFKDVELICWQYTGIDADSSATTSIEDFANINFKLDRIALDVGTTKELIGG